MGGELSCLGTVQNNGVECVKKWDLKPPEWKETRKRFGGCTRLTLPVKECKVPWGGGTSKWLHTDGNFHLWGQRREAALMGHLHSLTAVRGGEEDGPRSRSLRPITQPVIGTDRSCATGTNRAAEPPLILVSLSPSHSSYLCTHSDFCHLFLVSPFLSILSRTVLLLLPPANPGACAL